MSNLTGPSLCQRHCLTAMKPFAIVLLSLAVTTGSLFAADAKQAALPGTDDLSRYVATRPTPGDQTTLRDSSGRTLGTACTWGTRTTFRDSGGRTTGSAVIEDNRTVFRDATGRMVWTATTSGSKTTTYRDAAGRLRSTASAFGGQTIFRDASGRTTSTVQPAGSSGMVRDASGRTTGTCSTTGAEKPGSPVAQAARVHLPTPGMGRPLNRVGHLTFDPAPLHVKFRHDAPRHSRGGKIS